MRARGSFFNGGTIAGNIVTPLLKNGSGSPEGAVTAGVGAIYQDTTNGKLYEKVSGTGNTGWREVSPSVSGTYTPTGTIVTNLDSVTPGPAYYMYVGSYVHVWGTVTADPTAASFFAFRLSLPVASNFAAATDLAGITRGNLSTGYCDAAAATDDASMTCGTESTSAVTIRYGYGYKVI